MHVPFYHALCCCWVASVVSDSSPSGSPIPGILQARTLEWVAISFSDAWKWKVKVAQSCPTLCDPMDCSLPGSSVYGIFQTRILERVAISFSNHASEILLFYRWKVCGNCTLSKSVGAIFPTAFAYFMFLSHFGNSYISDFFIIIFFMVICDEWSLMLLLQLSEGSDGG